MNARTDETSDDVVDERLTVWDEGTGLLLLQLVQCRQQGEELHSRAVQRLRSHVVYIPAGDCETQLLLRFDCASLAFPCTTRTGSSTECRGQPPGR